MHPGALLCMLAHPDAASFIVYASFWRFLVHTDTSFGDGRTQNILWCEQTITTTVAGCYGSHCCSHSVFCPSAASVTRTLQVPRLVLLILLMLLLFRKQYKQQCTIVCHIIQFSIFPRHAICPSSCHTISCHTRLHSKTVCHTIPYHTSFLQTRAAAIMIK